MQNVPYYISFFFILTTLFTLYLLYKATQQNTRVLIIAILWLVLQGAISLTGFYAVTGATPPRFPLLILPPVLTTIILFATKQGRLFIDSCNIKQLTYLHIIRIPVEVTLYMLMLYKQVPQLMTFEGRNFDILSGLTAPIIAYWGYSKPGLPKSILLMWNIICLGLLLNVVVNAVLSAPFPFQRFAFDQPNVAVLHFPYVWLPCFLVPVVLFSHLAAIRQLLIRR